jgi:3-oxoacyl-[acyl-carrier protein] reductase
MTASYVVGASGDIGRAIAAALIDAGHDTALSYNSNEASVRELQEQAKEAGTTSVVGQCDTRSAAAIEATYQRFTEAIGPPTSLVYCAGVRRDGPVLQMSDADWADVLDTNLRGAMQFMRLAGADMVRARAGQIILISSVSGQAGVPGQANYGASKAGLESMVRSSARELGQFGVTINAVAPGLVEGAMTADLPASLKRGYLARIALRRFACPEDIAPVVRFLTSDGARYITGQTIVVDGGLTA